MKKEIGSIQVMQKLLTLVTALMGKMSIAVLMGVLGFLCAIFLPVSAALYIASVLGFLPDLLPSHLLLFMIVIAVLRGFLHYIEQACNHDIAFRLLAILRDKIFGKLRELAPAKLEGREKGNLINLITTDIELLEVFYAHTISPILIAFFTCLILLVLFYQIHVVYFIIALFAYGYVGILLPYQTSKKGRETGIACRHALADLSTIVLESIRGLREILQYDQGNARLQRLQKQSETVNEYQKELRKIEGKNSGASGAAVQFFSVLLLFCGLGFFVHGTLNFAQVLVGTVLLFSSFGPVIALSNVSNNLLLTLASGRRVLQLLEEQPQVEEVMGQSDAIPKDLSLNHVSFAYEDELILNDVNETFQQGKITGILGKSGSGKSTMLKLLMRFWDCQSGEVCLHDRNLKSINTKQLRTLQSYVTQDTVLFHDTILNNIKIANPTASQEEVIKACQKANIHEFIQTLPQGYQSDVAELGDSLSGGEKQRIALARAFLHDSEYILLDEPTSNLDILNESMVLQSLKQLEGKTILLVSHRASTMSICDEILHMAEGRIS